MGIVKYGTVSSTAHSIFDAVSVEVSVATGTVVSTVHSISFAVSVEISEATGTVVSVVHSMFEAAIGIVKYGVVVSTVHSIADGVKTRARTPPLKDVALIPFWTMRTVAILSLAAPCTFS